MSESNNQEIPESRLAELLIQVGTVLDKGASLQKALELIPEEKRPQIDTLLSGASDKPAAPPESSHTPTIIIPKFKDVEQVIEELKLEEGYRKEVERHNTFGLLKPDEILPFDNVIEWLKGINSETLKHVKDFQGTDLVLETKGRSFNDLVEAMDANRKVEDQNKTYVSDIYNPFKNQKRENWGVGITESDTDLQVHGFDNKNLILSNRFPLFAEYKKTTGVSGMDEMAQAHFAMNHVLKTGKFPDQENWTILPESPALSDSQIPDAGFDPDRRKVGFDWGRPEGCSGGGRFRRSVRGDVQIA